MTEGMEDSSAGLVVPPGSASPAVSSDDPGRAPMSEEPEEMAPGSECGEEGAEGDEEGGDRERTGALGLAGLAGTCCVCIQMEQVHRCLRSEKICILPILACLLSLALCTAGLKWVFVDKIFEYDPPTHLHPKRMGQDPISADPTYGLPVSLPHPSSTAAPPTTTTIGQPEVLVEGKVTGGPFVPHSPRVTPFTPSSALTFRTDPPTQPGPSVTPKQGWKGTPTPYPLTTVESNDILIPTISATSTTPTAKTSSHLTPCNDTQKNYCVNGGECFTLEVMPGSTKFQCRCLMGYTGNRCQETEPKRVMSPKHLKHSCQWDIRVSRCPNEFTGDRCQSYVMASFYKAEELYQKRVLTITGICIALLVVGIMCVVAYCKTKKQRQRLHDRLRQSLRNERNNMTSMANGPHIPTSALENVQLVNQYVSKNAMPAKHVIEKETETSFSTSQYASTAHQSTTVTHTSSQSWSNGRSESVLSDSRSILVMSSAESSRHATPSHRGRLNATGGARDLSAYLKSSRATPESYRDSPYSERYVSAMTTPTRLSPVRLPSPVTPSSPPSEMSAPLSSLATPVPSAAVSPSGEEERPLLFATPPPRDKPPRHDHSQHKRNSAHYNHGLDIHSPPHSPLKSLEEDDYRIKREYELKREYDAPPVTAAAAKVATGPSQGAPKKQANANNNNNSGHRAKRTKANGHVGHKAESGSGGSKERMCSESETEDERVGEDTPFLSIQNPMAPGLDMAAAAAGRPTDSSRTNPALRLSPQDDLPARLPSAIANQDPIAV